MERAGSRNTRRALIVLAVAAALVAAATAVAALPKVATGGAKSVTASSAVLTGTVDPSGEPTTYHFEYGPGKPYALGPAAYPSRTPDQGPTAPKGKVGASATISGLSPATAYHYRLVAVNASGTKAGGDKSFTTPGAGVAITLSASPRTIRFRGTTHLTGQLGTRAPGGVKVALQEEAPPFDGKHFKGVATTRTDSSGRFAFSRSPIHNRAYRAVAGTKPKATSGTLVVGVRSRVTIAHVGRRGRTVTFGGSVGPSRDGQLVRIQRRVRGGWRTVKRGVLGMATDPDFSSFRVRVRLRRSGRYRAYVSRNSENLAGASRARRLRVR
jgi:hypothetical protein